MAAGAPRSPPQVVSVTGDGLTGNTALCVGFYKLEAGRQVNDRPVWRHASGRDRYMAFGPNGGGWRVQQAAELGSTKGILFLVDDCAVPWARQHYPSDIIGLGRWRRWDGTTWHLESSLTCVEATLPPVPRVVELTGDDDAAAQQSECLGFYQLETGREVNGRPVWRHASGRDRFLAFCSAGGPGGWCVQNEAVLGSDRVYLQQSRPSELQPTLYPCDASEIRWTPWLGAPGTALKNEPSLMCVEATLPPVPKVIELTGDGITGIPALCLGFYKLEEGREVNGRPVWRHAEGRDRFLAFDSMNTKWKVQSEAVLGSDKCLAHRGNKATLYPCGAAVLPECSWKVFDGAVWKREPSLVGVELRIFDSIKHEQDKALHIQNEAAAKIELTGLLSSVRIVRTRRWAEASSLLSDFKPLTDAVTSVPDAAGLSGVGFWCGTGQNSLLALKQILRSCREEVASKAKVLRKKQQLVSVAASPATTSVASLGDDGEARLKNAVADRDKARCAYADAISSHLPKVKIARTLDELRNRAATATADAASVASKLTQARRFAAQKGFTLEPAAIREELAIRSTKGVDELRNRRACDFLVTARCDVAAYKAATDQLPTQSQETDTAARALQSALQGQWLEPDATADEAIVGLRLRSLAEKVEIERRHWDELSHPFPYAALLQAGAIASTVRNLEAKALRSALEKHEELQAELEKETALVNTKVDEIETALQQAKDKVEEAQLDLEEEGTKLKRAKRQSGVLYSSHAEQHSRFAALAICQLTCAAAACDRLRHRPGAGERRERCQERDAHGRARAQRGACTALWPPERLPGAGPPHSRGRAVRAAPTAQDGAAY